jgi:hypothetical protein
MSNFQVINWNVKFYNVAEATFVMLYDTFFL